MPNGDVQFDFDTDAQTSRPQYSNGTSAPKTAQWMIRYFGAIIKSEAQASYVIWGAAVLFFLVAFFIFSDGNREMPYQPTQDEINRAMNQSPVVTPTI